MKDDLIESMKKQMVPHPNVVVDLKEKIRRPKKNTTHYWGFLLIPVALSILMVPRPVAPVAEETAVAEAERFIRESRFPLEDYEQVPLTRRERLRLWDDVDPDYQQVEGVKIYFLKSWPDKEQIIIQIDGNYYLGKKH